METKKINYAKEKQYGYTRHIENVVNHNAEVLENALSRISKLEKTKLSALQPVVPTQNWIPVKERLPEENGFYLATYDGEICGENEPFTGLAEYENGKWVDDEEDYQCVLAWMHLPKPYKGENENKGCENCHYNDGEPHAECVVCDKAAGKDAKEKVIAEIDKQEEWLAEAGYNAYNVDIAFGSIIRALRKMC